MAVCQPTFTKKTNVLQEPYLYKKGVIVLEITQYIFYYKNIVQTAGLN